jgi:hypothetical protein
VPIHDWTRVDAGLFHAFHQSWIVHLCDALNAGGLSPEYFALPEQSLRGLIPDVLTSRLSEESHEPSSALPGLAVATAPPRARLVQRLEAKLYTRKTNRVTIRHKHGQIVAVVEIVSPGNRVSTSEIRAFVEKASDLIERGVHLLVIDLFPPSKRDPEGIHKLIWDQLEDTDFQLPTDKRLAISSYEAGSDCVAYVYPVAAGDELPDAPLFLRSGFYIPAPLEASYQTTLSVFPAPLKSLLENPSVKSDFEQ